MGGLRGCQGLIEAGEAGDAAVKAGYGQDTDNGPAGGQDQPQLAAIVQGSLACRVQCLQPARIAEPGAGQVHHDGGMPVCGCSEKSRPEPLRGVDVDLATRNTGRLARQP